MHLWKGKGINLIFYMFMVYGKSFLYDRLETPKAFIRTSEFLWHDDHED